ncbi:glutamate racemase [uncultured Limosilactobacillus sp.]|uniref:glutamate racemase n=1 Tax=uncultured Limosilactobacillus sp. TaxID=2837629 RepID=UPI0025FACCFA|nr:glutamate racemase [uncultured Limosilactobacillus sp.]
MDNRPIGVMDSGLGGLSVMRIMRQQMPQESLIFVGDQGHFPYGTKSATEIRRFALNIGHFLVRHHVKLMVVACNTATAEALPLLQTKLPIPVIGVVQPGARAAIAANNHQRIGVIATTATTATGIYPRALHQLSPNVTVFPLATQPLVTIVEHRQTGTAKAQQLVDRQLSPLAGKQLDALIMGCTHFPFLQMEFRKTLGSSVALIDPAEETVKQVQDYLRDHKLLAGANRRGRVRLYSTGSAVHLTQGARGWLHDSTLFGHHVELAESKDLE